MYVYMYLPCVKNDLVFNIYENNFFFVNFFNIHVFS